MARTDEPTYAAALASRPSECPQDQLAAYSKCDERCLRHATRYKDVTMIDQTKLNQLREDAKCVLCSRNGNTDAVHPNVIEFTGSPKAGKTTTIDIVGHFYRRLGFRVWAPSEGASKRTPYHLKKDLVAFNSWSLNYAISEILLAYHNVDSPDLIILDRGPFDSLAWMAMLQERGDISEDNYNTIKDYATLEKWASLVSKIFVFVCSPQVSLERENESKLTAAPGTAMNNEMLTAMLTQYEKLAGESRAYPIIRIDTSNGTSQKETAYKVAREVLETLKVT